MMFNWDGQLTQTISVLEVVWTAPCIYGVARFSWWAYVAWGRMRLQSGASRVIRTMASIRFTRSMACVIAEECWALLGIRALGMPNLPSMDPDNPVALLVTGLLLAPPIVLIGVGEYVHYKEKKMDLGLVNVLVVDDDPTIRDVVTDLLTMEGFVVRAVEAPEALAVIGAWPPDVAIVDLMMPGIDGEQVVRRIREVSPWVKIILFSAHAETRLAETARSLGLRFWISKPFDADEMLRMIRG